MNNGRSPLEAGPSLYHTPQTDHGRLGERIGRILAREEVSEQPDYADSEFIPDSDKVTVRVEEYMGELYGSDRYGIHIDRILNYYGKYVSREATSEDNQIAIEIDSTAIALHDFVDHAILNPEKTASRLERSPEEATFIKRDAVATFNEMLDDVCDQDELIKAYLFAIDASHWEAAARIWRQGANNRIKEMQDDEKNALHPYSAKIVTAAVNKDTALLDEVGVEELTRVLRSNVLLDLKLGAISEGAINHNIQGLFLKALETLDVIEHPPTDNPASTWRDCTEAINFFVPALATLGYKELAMGLRGAALKWLFEDPGGNAKQQYELSAQHFDDVKDIVIGLREEEFKEIKVNIEHRVKTEGSIRAKLASKNYIDLHKVPDGIGFAFVVPDTMNSRKMEIFARAYMDRLTGEDHQIIARHPNPAEHTFEKKKRTSEEGGYEAIHMAFYYYPKDGSGESVPFEIQVLTETQQSMKLHGPSSDLFYKLDTQYALTDQPHLDRLAKRGRAEREMAPGSTIQSISEAVSLTPEIPFVFNKLFRSVDISNDRRILVTPELKELAHELSDNLAEVFGESEGLTVLPPTKVSEAQFLEALSMISRDLIRNPKILKSLSLIKQSEAGKQLRSDGKTTTMEGHILPTALYALMLAIQTGKIWESENQKPSEYMTNIVTIAILHDHIEEILEDYKNDEVVVQLQKRQDLLSEIKKVFGAEISDGVDALTLPMEIKDQHDRREQYRKNVQANGYARLIKPADRWQNHVTDLVKLATNEAPKGSPLYAEILAYFSKTDRYQSDDFTSQELSRVYARVHDVIWRFARHYGYQQKTKGSKVTS